MVDAILGTFDKLAQILFFLFIAGTVAFVGAVFAFVL